MKKPSRTLRVEGKQAVARTILPPPPGSTPDQAEKFRMFQQMAFDFGRSQIDAAPSAQSKKQ